MTKPKVLILMGSDSDLPVVSDAVDLLEEMGVAAELGPWTPAAVFEEIRARALQIVEDEKDKREAALARKAKIMEALERLKNAT